MTNAEINQTYNLFRGVHSYNGNINVLTALTHYFLMDASYDNFKHHIETLPLKRENRQIVKRMREVYDSFFKKFFAPFSLDQRIYLGEKSDELREHIANDVEIARIAFMECCDEEPVERQIEIANIWLCNRFASEAQDFYKRTWKKSGFKLHGVLYTKSDSDKDIDAILKYTIALTERLYGGGENVTPKHYEKFQKCVAVLTKKIAEWIQQNYQEEIYEQSDSHTAAIA